MCVESKTKSTAWHEPTGTYTINGIPFAYSDAPLGFLVNNYATLSAAFAMQAMDRRWTVTAVALQQYRLSEGRWPKDLAELRSVGLSRSDWLAIGDQPFGYRVEGDPPAAILWTIPPDGLATNDPAVPPGPSE